MSKIAFPLGFKIVENTGTSNTGTPIDERLIFASETDRDNYIDNFFYEGLLSYTIGLPYHGSGVTSDAGFYYRNSSDTWVGLNSDTIDDKHASGTMDSGSTSTSDPTTGTNIVDHINYQYSLISAVSTSRTWKSPVVNFADLATTYPTPMIGWTALVSSENSIYTYDGSVWIKTGGNIPALSSTVSGIVSATWYNTLYDLVTNPTTYQNKNVFGGIIVQNNGSGVTNSPISATSSQDSFTINVTGSLTTSVSGKTITINGTSGGVVAINDNFIKWDDIGQYYRFYNDKTEAGGGISGGKLFKGTDGPADNVRLNYDGYFYATKLYSGGVEVQPLLPSQSGNAGKYLQTDGSSMNWQSITAIAGLQNPVSYIFTVTNNTTSTLVIPNIYSVYSIKSVTVNGIEYYETSNFTIGTPDNNTIVFEDNLPYDALMGNSIVKVVFIEESTETIAETLSILTNASMVSFDPTGTDLISTNMQDAIVESSNKFKLLESFYNDLSTSGITETDLYSYTIPANTLNSDGDLIKSEFYGTFTSDTGQSLKLYFAGSNIFTHTLPLLQETVVRNWSVNSKIIRVSDTSVKAVVTVQIYGNDGFQNTEIQYNYLISKDLSIDNIFKLTGISLSGNVIAKFGMIEYYSK